MITRKDYLEGKFTHSEYYGQFTKGVGIPFTDQELLEAYKLDKNLNSIPLRRWDSRGHMVTHGGLFIGDKMKKAGDYLTQSGIVCILKEAARQRIESISTEAQKDVHKPSYNDVYPDMDEKHNNY